MKKILSFLALVCLTVTGAWAQFPNAGEYYVKLTNKDTGNRPYIHNALAENTFTLQSTSAGNTNDYIWKVVSDGAGNITSIVNGDGRGVGTNGQYQGRVTSLQYKDKGNGYYYLTSSVIKAAKNDHECLNRSNGGYKNSNGDWTVTTWVGENKDDNLWKVETVDVSTLNVYNVVVTGAEGYVTYSTTSEYAYNGGFFLATGTISETDLVASTIPAYNSNVSVSGNTITVAYEADQSQLELNALIATAEAAYASNDEPLAVGDGLITATSQFSSNASQSDEGSLDNLLDGNLGTYWHSQWGGGDKPMHTHYLQVELSEAISGQIQMTMGRRSDAANDHPVKMSVEYSADNSTYTLLPGYMEFEATTGYVTGNFTLPTDAKYLRFFNDDSNGSMDRGYWHCSEFQLNPVTKSANIDHPTEAAAMLAAIATAKAITSGATQENIDALQNAIDTYKAAVDLVKTNITWELYDGTTLLNSETKTDCEKGRQYTTTLTVPFGYAIEGNKTVTATDENQTITLNRVLDPNFPFEYADSKDNIEHWYALNLHCNNKHYAYYSADATPNVKADVTTYQTADEYAWGFVGNPTDGFVIYNKASGTALYSADNSTSCTVGSTASTFKATLTGWATAQADGGFCLNVEGQQYVNWQDNELKHWTDNDAGSTFHAIEIDFSALKTYAYVLTDADGNTYEGTFTSAEEHPHPACVEGFALSNENWEDVSEISDDVDYVYTATITFPFPVNTPTAISGFPGYNTPFWLRAAGNDIVVKKGDAAVNDDYAWIITPAFADNTFTYTFQSVKTEKYVKVNATGSNHNQGAVTLDVKANATHFTYTSESFQAVGQTLYLSVNSSTTGDEQYVGVNNSIHNGSRMYFGDIVPAGLDITIGETGYATFYDIEAREVPEGVKVYYCIESENEATLDTQEWTMTDYIPPFLGVILELQEGYEPGTYTFPASDVDFDAIPEEVMEFAIDTSALWGSNEDITVDAAKAEAYSATDIYVFSKKNDKLGFYKFVGTTLEAHKAYYPVWENTEIQGFTLDFGGQTVGVSSVISATNLKAGYDIQGRRINKVQKGINILNGKKIIK